MEVIDVCGVRADPGLCELSRGDQTIRLEPKSMCVFLFLARNANVTCTREALFAHCWPQVRVGEDALNRVVYQLRSALAELGTDVRITTIPKIGYRLVAESQDTVSEPQPRQRTLPWSGWRSSTTMVAAFSAGGILVAGAAFTLWPTGPDIFSPVFTSPAIGELQPALSPDAKALVFVRKSGDDRQLVIRPLPDGPETILLNQTGTIAAPAWSPDGATIAYVAKNQQRCEYRWLNITSPTVSHSIGPCGYGPLPQLSWRPDGKAIYTSYAAAAGKVTGVYRLGLDGSRTLLTEPPETSIGDMFASASPDGRWLAFLREGAWQSGQVMLLDLHSRDVRPLTRDGGDIYGVAWSANSREVYVSIDHGNDRNVWSYPLDGKPPRRLLNGLASIRTLSAASERGGVLAVESVNARTALVRRDITSGQTTKIDTLAAGLNEDPSPFGNGQDVVFVSDRTGRRQLWRREGGKATPISLNLPAGIIQAPAVSPDGQRVAFVLLRDGRRQLHLAQSGGTASPVEPGHDTYSPLWLGPNQLAYVSDGRLHLPSGKVLGEGIEAARNAGAGDWYVSRRGNEGIWRMDDEGRFSPVIDAFIPYDGWDVTATQFAWVDKQTFTLWTADRNSSRAVKETAKNTGYQASVHATVRFTPDGRSIWFGIPMNYETRVQVFQSR
ncbi:LpqB family beta-propeller domain-containing protein [Asticcacaulis sp. AND118]|uniref:LpqB family beta-propeller domain-containing protein n=1 Tax=Asticcacaulis sp. AND118 TaxID=2840468 RepID=UPI001CFF64D0|nr:LpqB family beta-propeller domain-containing protein [Asticcacaulis sp. AND118]UDF04977.1 winged helix-turn-helix transcriptional regulator [Asticcacaulis sp. AND118]